jgi:peptidoglycan/xylan/chitin deacetylase (PgdA/CDA1 family)
MRYVRFFFSIAALAALSGCSGTRSLSVGTNLNNVSTATDRRIAGGAISKETPAAVVRPVAKITSASPADKLIALTFDDGPRPYVLFGSKENNRGPGLVDILDQNGVKATFFVVGWRLTPKTWGEPRHEENIGVSCLDAAEQLIRRGHELEDHT